MHINDDGSSSAVHDDYTEVTAVPYDVPVIGYKNRTVNTLRLWNAEANQDFSDYASLTNDEIKERQEYRNKVNKITEFLYPNDSTDEGKRLRLVQEYFFVSAGVQSIVRHFMRTHDDVSTFADKVCIQINDTHPAVAVAELMRVFIDDYGLDWDVAWDITSHTIAYTNHTILPEALEKWDRDLFKNLLPRIYMIIDEINRRFLYEVRSKYPGDENLIHELSIIQDGQVHMARLAVVGSFSVNGVARLHTNILKESTLKYFYQYYPDKFNNKTNGITHRRWLISANNALAHVIDDKLTRQWRGDTRMMKQLNQ